MENTPITYLLIIVNGIFTFIGFSNPGFYSKFLFHTGSIRYQNEYHRLLTSGFLHADWSHLLFNMFSLFYFCRVSESLLGSASTAIIYIGSLVAGNVIAYALHYNNNDYRAVGASGAVSGIIFSGVLLMPNSQIGIIFFPIPMPAWVYALIYVSFSMYGMRFGRDNIGHEAHLGGALGGLLLTAVFLPEIISTEPILFLGLIVPCIAVLVWGATRSNNIS
ncbi:MAG: rhomboid family intramembrane serine protease [Bacteroidetes bacterium]|nr:rhomboid family intramembrane serine protease [Bacteroidota bacterium]